MHTRSADGLLTIDLAQKMYVESKKVDDLAGGIDLSLKGILALSQHGGSIHIGTIFGSDQISCFQEDAGTVFPAHGGPAFFGSESCFDSLMHVFFITGMKISQRMRYFMWRMHGHFFIGPNFLGTDVHRHIYLFRFKFGQHFFQTFLFSRTGSVIQYRFIYWQGRSEEHTSELQSHHGSRMPSSA